MLVNKETLIAKYLSGNASAEEITKLNDWRKQHPSNEAEFKRSEKFWSLSLNLKKDSEADVENAWSEFKVLTETQTEFPVRKTNSNWLKIAAAITLFIVTSVVVKMFFTGSSKVTPVILSEVAKPAPSEPITVSTPDMNPLTVDSVSSETPVRSAIRQERKFVFPSTTAIAMITVTARDSAEIFMLPDNSIVYLNANSKLEYPQNFNRTNRRVSLIGEAYFDVKKDSGQFVVACENTIIRGKGTSFNVKSHSSDKEVEVIVASGSVEFSGIGYKDFKKLVITTGESGYYNKSKSEIIKSKTPA